MKQYYLLFLCWSACALARAQCPAVLDCSTQTDTFPAVDANEMYFWNAPAFYDPVNDLHDLAEAVVDLHISVVDSCSTDSLVIAYALELDLNGDGQPETRVHSDEQTPWTNFVYFNNMNGTGVLATFDNRLVDAEDQYFFQATLDHTGDTVTAQVCWRQQSNPDYCQEPYLPLGKHRIRWFVRNGAAADTCVQEFVVRDAAPPAVECESFLSVELAGTTSITVWANDFILAKNDNITPENAVSFAIVPTGSSAGVFPFDCEGFPNTSITLHCPDIGLHEIQVWVMDLAGNADFCVTNLLLTDPAGNCDGSGGEETTPICVQTESSDPVSGVAFNLEGNAPGIPPIQLFLTDTTSADGCWGFPNALPVSGTYSIIPQKNNHPLNGVTTFDLLLMSKHILGIQTLPSPYRLLAADINLSNSVTTYDIVELRKLILGIYTDFPNNDSWRFVDKSYVFPDPIMPWSAPDFISLNMLLNCSHNFIGIKVGDLNLSADPSGAAGPADDRGPARPLWMPDETLKAGETVDIPLQLPAGDSWSGAQFALRFDPAALDIEAVRPGDQPDFADDNYALFPDRLHLSWVAPTGAVGNTLAYLRVRALRDCRPSEVFSLDNSFMQTEAYTAAATQHDLALAFGERATSVQAWPNPTRGAAHIAFTLPQAGGVWLRLTDAAGSLVFETTRDLPAGDNTIEVPESATRQGGVFFWQVDIPGAASGQSGKLLRW